MRGEDERATVQQIGRYQIIERLGRGAMGVVYKALDPRIGRTVAVKSIRLAEISDASELKRLRDRLEREARSAGALSHRNIVAIYDILEEEKLVHLFMEYVNGPSLDKLLTEGKLPEKEMLLNFFRQVASALDYAHKIGIVHRDVKPSNLLIHFEHATGEQLAKVTDFGVAKFISQQMTQAGSMMGTPNYMAPEQIEGGQITGQADQFALAAVAYEVLCGEKPFVADYIPTLFFRIVREDPKAANQVNPRFRRRSIAFCSVVWRKPREIASIIAPHLSTRCRRPSMRRPNGLRRTAWLLLKPRLLPKPSRSLHYFLLPQRPPLSAECAKVNRETDNTSRRMRRYINPRRRPPIISFRHQSP